MQGKACEEDMAEEWGVSLVEYCSEIRGERQKGTIQPSQNYN